MNGTSHPTLKLRIEFPGDHVLGPGKAELLERILATGSISAAGRDMGMSYRRAWTLVEAMNAMFSEPLVSASRGGAHGGGAAVTEAGLRVLGEYRQLEARMRKAVAPHVAHLTDMLAEGAKAS